MPSDESHTVSPVEQIIREVIEPQRDELHIWKNTMKHQQILVEDARNRRKTSALKLGPGFLFHRAGTPIGGTTSRVTTLVSGQAFQATQTTALGHEYLRASGVPTVEGRAFHTSLLDAAQEYRARIGTGTVVRPAAARARPATTLAVTSAEGMEREWKRAADALAHLESADRQIRVESFSTDLALRVFVVGERVVAAVARIPFYIIGDGSSSALHLIENEWARREECRYLSRRFPQINEHHVASLGHSTDDILPEGEISVLDSAPSGAPGGGLSVDVLDDLSDELKALAVDAMWAFPGLSASAVDIRTPALAHAEGALVQDVVPSADISEFIYPAHGARRGCGLAMLDHMIRNS